jgi:hypothetical protein
MISECRAVAGFGKLEGMSWFNCMRRWHREHCVRYVLWSFCDAFISGSEEWSCLLWVSGVHRSSLPSVLISGFEEWSYRTVFPSALPSMNTRLHWKETS